MIDAKGKFLHLKWSKVDRLDWNLFVDDNVVVIYHRIEI